MTTSTVNQLLDAEKVNFSVVPILKLKKLVTKKSHFKINLRKF